MSIIDSIQANRLPPYSEEAERGVLGSILLDYRAMDIALEYNVTAETFYVPAHATIFEAMLKTSEKTQTADVITVIEELGEAIDRIGGVMYLDTLVDKTPTSAHCEYYIEIIVKKWELRAVVENCRKTEAQCFKDDADADDILSDSTRCFEEIDARKKRVEVTWDSTIRQSMTTVQGILESDDTFVGISTGFRNLDATVLGLKSPDLIILAARPAMGKSAMSMNIAENVAREGTPVGIFSLEMPAEQIAFRMKCGFAEIDSNNLLKRKMSQTDHSRLVQAAATLCKYPLHCDDSSGLDIAQLRLRARRMKAKHGIGLLIVDYLQLLHSRQYAAQGKQFEVSHISQQLKETARELEIPVLALAQLSRSVEKRDPKNGIPILADLRDSGSLEQDADLVLLLRRTCKYPESEGGSDDTLAVVTIAKHRGGPCGTAWLNFVAEHTKFRDRAYGVQDEMEMY